MITVKTNGGYRDQHDLNREADKKDDKNINDTLVKAAKESVSRDLGMRCMVAYSSVYGLCRLH